MRILNEQAQLFMAAAACMFVGCVLLAYALEFWLRAVDAACKAVGIYALIQKTIWERARHGERWYRIATWYERWYRIATWYQRAFRGE